MAMFLFGLLKTNFLILCVSVYLDKTAAKWPSECKYTDGLACYRYCATAPDGTYGTPSEPEALCYNGGPKSPIAKESYEYARVHMRLPISSGFTPQAGTDDGESGDPWQFDSRCFCFRSLTEDEIGNASPVDKMREDLCQYHSIRCLRKVELGDTPSCAESYFRCQEQKDADGSDTRAKNLRAELCQRFKDIDASYADVIQSVQNVEADDIFSEADRGTKLKLLADAKKEYNTRREVACEGKRADGSPINDKHADG